MSAIIAAEAMHRLPRLRSYGAYPENTRFGDFHVSYDGDLGELVARDAFLYAGSTNWNHCSFDLNNETMLTITGGSAPGRFEQLFETDWSDRSELVAERPTIPRLWFYQALAYMLN